MSGQDGRRSETRRRQEHGGYGQGRGRRRGGGIHGDGGGADCARARGQRSTFCRAISCRARDLWSDEDYPWLTDHSRRLIEFTDGQIEELPLPTFTHQAILSLLEGFVAEVAEVSDAPESGA